jgi:hypothetical protein
LWTFWASTLVWSVVWPDQTLGALSSNFITMPRKTAFRNSCKKLSMIQWSDKKLWTSCAGTLVWSVVWPHQTSSMSSSEYMTTLRKTTSEKSCKKLSTSERSNQKLWTIYTGTLVWSVVWRDQTLGVSSSNFIMTPRKTASGNSCKKLSMIQCSDKKLWTSCADTLVWSGLVGGRARPKTRSVSWRFHCDVKETSLLKLL